MTSRPPSTRRSFLKGGAVAAAPLAGAGAAAAMAQSQDRAKIARLEDEAAIRDLHQAWLRKVNTGARAEAARLFADPGRASLGEAVSRIAADHEAGADRLTLASDGRSAQGRYNCVVETAVELARDCTLALMAHAQGEGMIRRSERRVLSVDYVKTDAGGWAISKLRFQTA